MKIIVSFKKKPNLYSIETINEVRDYVYNETYGMEIEHKKKFVNTL